jgi:hypothetical protein
MGAVQDLASHHELARRVRRNPVPWLTAGVLAGALAGRFFARPMWQSGKKRLAAVATGRLQNVVLGLVAAIAARQGVNDAGADVEIRSAPLTASDARPRPLAGHGPVR